MRKKTLGGFFAFATVYNAVESKVAEKGENGEETVSFAFDGAPNSSYYLIVSTYNHQDHGSYELLVRKEDVMGGSSGRLPRKVAIIVRILLSVEV